MVSPTDVWSRSADLSDAPEQASTYTCIRRHVQSRFGTFLLQRSCQEQAGRCEDLKFPTPSQGVAHGGVKQC